MGQLIKAEPGDAIISSATNRVLLNVNGVLRLFKEAGEEHPFGIEEYVKQAGPFFYNTVYTPSKEFITLAVISQGTTNEHSFMYINGKETAELEYHGSITPATFIIPIGQTWKIKGATPGELKSVAYAFFPASV
jgi:hypothetical protein